MIRATLDSIAHPSLFTFVKTLVRFQFAMEVVAPVWNVRFGTIKVMQKYKSNWVHNIQLFGHAHRRATTGCISLNEYKLCDWHSCDALCIKCTNCVRAVCNKQTSIFGRSRTLRLKSLQLDLAKWKLWWNIQLFSFEVNANDIAHHYGYRAAHRQPPSILFRAKNALFSHRWHRFIRIIRCAQFHPLICQIKSVGKIQGFNVQLIAPLTWIANM